MLARGLHCCSAEGIERVLDEQSALQVGTAFLLFCRSYGNMVQDSWRPNGLFQAPINEFLRDDQLPRQQVWGSRSIWRRKKRQEVPDEDNTKSS